MKSINAHILTGSLVALLFATSCHRQSQQLKKADNLYHEGLSFLEAKQSEAAAESFSQALLAINVCDTKTPEALRLNGQIENQLGMRYYKHGLFDDALPLHQDAVAIFRDLPDSLLLMEALRNEGRVEGARDNLPQALVCYDESLLIAQTLHQTDFENELCIELARDVYMPSVDYQKVIELAHLALQHGAREDLCHLDLGLADYYTANDSLAIVYLNQALKSEKPGIRMSAAQALHFVYQLREDYQQSVRYLELCNENRILADEESRAEELLRIKAGYDLQLQKLSLESSQRLRNILLYSILSLLFLLLLFALLLLRQKTLRAQLKSEESKNQLILALKKNKVYVTALALTEQITASSINFNLEEYEWDDFVTLIDLIHNHFTERLLEQYPTLTNGDLQICCLTRQGFSNQVISILLNQQTNSYTRRKSRMKQDKMNGLNDPRSFEEIINSI